MKKALCYGILGSLFFAFTFIFNRSMNLAGGYWAWSACLRYFFTLPILLIPLLMKGQLGEVMKSIKKNTGVWLLWSIVGFGLFYAPLSMASLYGESWFVAATWQITIVAGVLLTPVFGQRIPVKNLFMSGVILVGIVLLQMQHIKEGFHETFWIAMVLILIAAFSYPLGNRKMMISCKKDNLNTLQRVFGMTLMSMPFWIILSIMAMIRVGLPSTGQAFQSGIVALFSGVIATVLFFEATNMMKDNPKQLAVIEATQSGEVLFTLVGGCLFLKDDLPDAVGGLGILIIVVGMMGNSMIGSKKNIQKQKQ